jgi:predicted DNA-binding protein (MmcQ/YjbR family)
VSGKDYYFPASVWITVESEAGVNAYFKEEVYYDGKLFAAVCLNEEDEPYYITLKLEPEEGDFLRKQYEDIVPGYYMNKVHWNSVRPDGAVPDDLLKDLLDKSYQLVLGGLSKKKQQEILDPLREQSGQ